MSTMEIIVQWATILSPIIAVLIACWTIKSSAKDVTMQIESIKKLAKIQIKTTQIQINKELWDANMLYQQTNDKIQDNNANTILNYLGSSYDSIHQRVDKNRDLSDKKDYYSQRMKWLNHNLTQLNELEKKLEGE